MTAALRQKGRACIWWNRSAESGYLFKSTRIVQEVASSRQVLLTGNRRIHPSRTPFGEKQNKKTQTVTEDITLLTEKNTGLLFKAGLHKRQAFICNFMCLIKVIGQIWVWNLTWSSPVCITTQPFVWIYHILDNYQRLFNACVFICRNRLHII